MSVYILDLEYDPANPAVGLGRNWGQMLPAPIAVTFDDRARPTRVVELTAGNEVVASADTKDVMVVHYSSIIQNSPRALKRTGIPLLIISRDSCKPALDGLYEDEYPCYYRRAGVLEATEDVDRAFAEHFSNFWNKYQQPEGEPDWALLEPEPWPRHLVALYLVAKSLELSGGTERTAILEEWRKLGSRNQIWQKAVEEYRGRGGATNKWPGTGLEAPDPSHDFDVGTAVAKIREVLAPR